MTKKTKTKVSRIPRFSSTQEGFYKERKRIDKKLSRLNKTIKELKAERDEVEEKLRVIFETTDRRLMSDGSTIVLREVVVVEPQLVTKEMEVGDVIKAGYEYPQYSEVALT